ncbi:hypothetical protein [Actinoallomurus sp. CA-142502]|uniref:hypothetical protein n=1 Tax=Actinoallomurus sp. CA-142502 TaxID=3239885 RepID=UPI003D949ABB
MGLQVLLIVVLVVLLAAGGTYFFGVVPRRWRIPLDESRELLDSADRADLERADRLIAQAVNAGPRGWALEDARFAQAYVRARLGDFDPDQYAAAAAALADLVAASGHDEATAFLDLWLRSKMGQHSRVCDLFESERALLDWSPQARLIASISFLKQAVASWRRREPQGALHYFRQVRELDCLTAEIPEHVDDMELVEGVQALFDDRMSDARGCFTNAHEHAVQEGKSAARATLGLLVCDWREGERANADGGLGAVLEELAQTPDPDPEEQRLRVNAALFHVVTLLHEWQRPELAGVAPGRADFARLDERIDRVVRAEPDHGDALLIAGLCRYYFAVRDPAMREQGVALLERGLETARPIVHPEARRIVRFERELGDTTTGRDRYVELIDESLRNGDLSPEKRRELLALRAEMERRYARYGDPAAVAADAGPAEHPSVRDISESNELMRARLRGIAGPLLRDDPERPGVEELKQSVDEVDAASKRFKDGFEAVQSARQDLIVRTGEFLLNEAPPEKES